MRQDGDCSPCPPPAAMTSVRLSIARNPSLICSGDDFVVIVSVLFSSARETYVALEMGVGDYLSPEKFHPSSIKRQIEAALEKEDYLGEVFVGAENTWSTELESKYEGSTIEVQQYKGVHFL